MYWHRADAIKEGRRERSPRPFSLFRRQTQNARRVGAWRAAVDCHPAAIVGREPVIGKAGPERVAPRVGIEPTTIRLTVECSTAELPGNKASAIAGAITKPSNLCKAWRPRPELNRGTRICSPLRNHSATWPSGHSLYRSVRTATTRRRSSTAPPNLAFWRALPHKVRLNSQRVRDPR